jgi:hypothetical protein
MALYASGVRRAELKGSPRLKSNFVLRRWSRLRHAATLSNSQVFFHALRTSVPSLGTHALSQLFDHAAHDPFSHSASFQPHTLTSRVLQHSLCTTRRRSFPPLNLHRARVRRKSRAASFKSLYRKPATTPCPCLHLAYSRFRYGTNTSQMEGLIPPRKPESFQLANRSAIEREPTETPLDTSRQQPPIKACAAFCGLDVVVHAEEVCRVVFVFQGDEAIVIAAVHFACDGVALIGYVVDVSSSD